MARAPRRRRAEAALGRARGMPATQRPPSPPQDRHLHGSRLGGPVRDLRCITQKYTNYAETHDLRVFAIYAIYAEIPVLRSFYAALRSQIHYAFYSEGGGGPPLPSVSVMMRNKA